MCIWFCLCFVVVLVCGDCDLKVVIVVVIVIELFYCVFLVYDDMLCFDNVGMCWGKLLVYMEFGEEIVLFVGDGLIVLVFEMIVWEI